MPKAKKIKRVVKKQPMPKVKELYVVLDTDLFKGGSVDICNCTSVHDSLEEAKADIEGHNVEHSLDNTAFAIAKIVLVAKAAKMEFVEPT